MVWHDQTLVAISWKYQQNAHFLDLQFIIFPDNPQNNLFILSSGFCDPQSIFDNSPD